MTMKAASPSTAGRGQAGRDGLIWAVIPAWNALGRLPEVLEALRGQVIGAVVVDNGSTDGTGDWLEGRGRRSAGAGDAAPTGPSLLLRVLVLPDNRGWPTAVNLGARAAWDMGATAVLILNDDALVQPEAVGRLAAVLAADPRAAAASARLAYRDRPNTLNGAGGMVDRRRAFAALRGEGEPDEGQFDHAPDPDYPSGAASLIERAAWDAVGPFDEACYLYYEDVDWGLRAREAGWRVRYVPQALVLHLGSAATAADPARRRYYNVRNRLRFARRWGSGAARWRCWLETLGLAARQPARWCLPSRRRDAEAVGWAIVDHLRGRYGRSSRFG